MSHVIDAIDELVARCKDCLELRTFHEFHIAHPEVLDFLTEEIQLRLDHGCKYPPAEPVALRCEPLKAA